MSERIAYMVTTSFGGDEDSVIVFATNSATARREGANDFGVEWGDVDTCRRAKKFDQYGPGPVPASALFADGWSLGCSGCEREFSSMMTRDHLDLPIAPFVDSDDRPWCSAECCRACLGSEQPT